MEPFTPIKMTVWAGGGFVLGSLLDQVTSLPLAQALPPGGSDLPTTWPEAGVIGLLVGLLVWALRESYQRSKQESQELANLRVEEARDFSQRLEAIYQSKVQALDAYNAQLRDLHAQQISFVRDTLLAILDKHPGIPHG